MQEITEEFSIGINKFNPLVLLVKLKSKNITMGKLPFSMINGKVLSVILLHAHLAQPRTLSLRWRLDGH